MADRADAVYLHDKLAFPNAIEIKYSGLSWSIVIKEDKTPGDELLLDPPGAELLAWFYLTKHCHLSRGPGR